MKVDIAIIKNTLSILKRIGPRGLEEKALMTEIEVATGRPLTSGETTDHLCYCVDRGWICSRRDQFERTIYWLTDSGTNTLAGM